jgi:flagella basal body P-ring formation protein FlgA
MRLLGRLLIFTALLVLVLPVSEAWPEEYEPTFQFQTDAAAAGQYITLNDLAKLPPELAQKYGQALIWSAPPPGQLFTLTREFLKYRLTQMGLAEVLKYGDLPPAIQVRQTGIVLRNEDITAAFQRYVRTQNPWPSSDLNIQIYPQDEPILLPDKNFTLEVLPPKGTERFLGEVTLEMAILREGRAVKRFKVYGKVILQEDVVCANRQLSPHTAIKPGDVRLCRRDVTNLSQRDIFTAPKQVIGQMLAKGVGPQEILTNRHLSHLPLIKRGAEVRVILDQNGLLITTRGVTREDGYLGRSVRVQNSKSKKEFQAQVMDAKTVKVIL